MGKWIGQGTKTWNWEVDWCLERNSWFECKYDRSYFGLGNEWKWWSHRLIDMIIDTIPILWFNNDEWWPHFKDKVENHRMKKDFRDGDIAADLKENEENDNGREQLIVTTKSSCMNWNKNICKEDKARFDECQLSFINPLILCFMCDTSISKISMTAIVLILIITILYLLQIWTIHWCYFSGVILWPCYYSGFNKMKSSESEQHRFFIQYRPF